LIPIGDLISYGCLFLWVFLRHFTPPSPLLQKFLAAHPFPVQEPIYRPGGAEREDGAGPLAPAQEEDDDGDPPEDPKVSAEAHREGVRFLLPPPLDSLGIGTGLEWKYKSFGSNRLQTPFGFGCD